MMCAICEDKICLKGAKCCELSLYNSRDENIKLCLENKEDHRILESSAHIPKNIPRMEEVARYIDYMNIQKVGVAFCKGLQQEGRLIHEYLEGRGVEVHSVICGNGGIDNIAVGLCVGHDMLFNKYSQAPVTTLVVKDRVNSHNPLKALRES